MTSACAPTNLHRPFIDELTRPNPDDPTGSVDHACGCPRCSTAGSSRGRCRSPRCTTRSRTRTGSTSTSRPTSSSSTSTRAGAGSTRSTCWPRPCSTGPRFQNVICHGILLADDGAKLSKKLRNYTEPSEIFENQGVRRPAVVLHVHQHRAGRRHPDLRPGHRRRGPPGDPADPGTPIPSSPSTPTSRAIGRASAPTAHGAARPLHPGEDPRRSIAAVECQHGRLRPPRCGDGDPVVHRRAQQLVHPPFSRDRFWGTGEEAGVDLDRASTPSTPCSSPSCRWPRRSCR